jgi:tripartite-type tricarboxylate transporter receptor subunit TctC
MRGVTLHRSVAIALLAICATPVARAQNPADFYGRNVDLYVGYSAGGGYDVYAR